MEKKAEKSNHLSRSDERDLAKSQIEQALETFRTSISLLIQTITLLALADVTIVGYAISTQLSGILFIGALFPIMIYYVFIRVNSLTFPMLYTALSLEQKFGGNKSDWLASTFLSNLVSREYVNKLKEISLIEDSVERHNLLSSTSKPLVGSGRGFTRIALIIVALGQIIAPIILTIVFKWRLFELP